MFFVCCASTGAAAIAAITRPALRARILLLPSIAVLLRRVADSHGRANVHGTSTQWGKRGNTSLCQAGLSHMARPQGGDSIPPPERARYDRGAAPLRSYAIALTLSGGDMEGWRRANVLS